ncbi:hypothetical protein EYF80_029549 [Liparis tanakae]|uniref:Uncharacterized protein n=1 Tax=Liparis tanakae TaxID=230148 RepID=A0A4Z2H5U6_9TELE|nr:hypothetical protein EYF80_029549 [Liparis tanakae]
MLCLHGNQPAAAEPLSAKKEDDIHGDNCSTATRGEQDIPPLTREKETLLRIPDWPNVCSHTAEVETAEILGTERSGVGHFPLPTRPPSWLRGHR